jgi:hypothetical protein
VVAKVVQADVLQPQHLNPENKRHNQKQIEILEAFERRTAGGK